MSRKFVQQVLTHSMEREFYTVRLGNAKPSCVKNLLDTPRPVRPGIAPHYSKEESRVPALLYAHLQGLEGF